MNEDIQKLCPNCEITLIHRPPELWFEMDIWICEKCDKVFFLEDL